MKSILAAVIPIGVAALGGALAVYGGYDDSTYLAPDEQGPSISPPTESDTMRPPPGCRAQAYKVRSEDGGERSVEVVRCW